MGSHLASFVIIINGTNIYVLIKRLFIYLKYLTSDTL